MYIRLLTPLLEDSEHSITATSLMYFALYTILYTLETILSFAVPVLIGYGIACIGASRNGFQRPQQQHALIWCSTLGTAHLVIVTVLSLLADELPISFHYRLRFSVGVIVVTVVCLLGSGIFAVFCFQLLRATIRNLRWPAVKASLGDQGHGDSKDVPGAEVRTPDRDENEHIRL